jgi:tetratricopeptide (TPR) repeat protein
LSVQGKFEEAYALKQREWAIYQGIGDRRMIGIAHAEIGEMLYHQGKYPEAEDQIRRGMAYLQERSEMQIALRQRYLGDVLLAQGKNAAAWEAYQASFLFFQAVNEKGWMLTALTGLSRAELALGERPEAWEHALQALQIYREIRMYTFFAYLALAEIALLLSERGEIVRALELCGLVTRQGYLAQSRWFADLFGRPIEAAAAGIPLEEQIAARQRGRGLDFAETVERLLFEFSNPT